MGYNTIIAGAKCANLCDTVNSFLIDESAQYNTRTTKYIGAAVAACAVEQR